MQWTAASTDAFTPADFYPAALTLDASAAANAANIATKRPQ